MWIQQFVVKPPIKSSLSNIMLLILVNKSKPTFIVEYKKMEM